MIKFGIAGIPLSCKGRTVVDGIRDAVELGKKETGKGLEVVEIEILRPLAEIGSTEEIKKTARKVGVKLTVHAPYYTNLAGDKAEAERSREYIFHAGEIAAEIGAELLIIHLGMYAKKKEETTKKIIENIRAIYKFVKKKNKNLKLGLETSGKQLLFGTLDEIISVCKKIPSAVPVINFAHIHARGNGSLKEKKDFEEIFKKLKPLRLRHYYTHFSGVAYENSDESNLIPLKKGDLRFEPLAEYLLEKHYDVTIISASPLLEHDAINMKLILDRIKEKMKKRVPRRKVKKVKIKKKKLKKPKMKPEIKRKKIKKPKMKVEIKRKKIKKPKMKVEIKKKKIKKPKMKPEIKRKKIKKPKMKVEIKRKKIKKPKMKVEIKKKKIKKPKMKVEIKRKKIKKPKMKVEIKRKKTKKPKMKVKIKRKPARKLKKIKKLRKKKKGKKK